MPEALMAELSAMHLMAESFPEINGDDSVNAEDVEVKEGMNFSKNIWDEEW